MKGHRWRSSPSLNFIPRRISLIDQTATALRVRLDGGEWSLSLPSETQLAADFQVGRNTVRSALAILESEGRLRTTNGRRREIIGQPCPKVVPYRRVILLMSRPVGTFPPSTTLWITGTQARLERLGWHFQLCVEPAAFLGRPTTYLKTLTDASPGAVWILHRSTAAMQSWFQEGGLKAVLAGSRHEGITLPQVDADFRAVSRHAAGRFLANGHRTLAILRPDDAFAGDTDSVAGFREGARDAIIHDIQCMGRPSGVIRALERLLQMPQPPTGLYVLHPEHCVTAISYLSKRGHAVPERVSVICRDDEPYLELLTPEPTRYRRNPQAMASKLAALVASAAGKVNSTRIMPMSVPGETLARRRSAEKISFP